MNDLVELWKKPTAEEVYMIVGWRQWADAGAISSRLPEYLVKQTNATQIGQIKPDDFYLFQVPGTHHFLRPEITLKDGYRQNLNVSKNEIFYSGDDKRGLVIFLGDEPHLNVERYATAFFDVAEALGVKRIAGVGGVYGPMPYDKDRDISCAYSLRSMYEELTEYAVRFSNYEGGATIGSYLLDQAEQREIEFFVFYAFVPAYDFSQLSASTQGLRIEQDDKAWYDLLRRLNHMFRLGLDLTDLERQSAELIFSMETKIDAVDKTLPQLNIRDYIAELTDGFTERPFIPLSEVWEEELGDLFGDEE